MPDNEFLNMQEAWSFCLSLTKKIVEEYSMMNKAVYLLQYRFQECRSTKVAIEMDLDLLARIRNRLELAEINNAGFNKEIDKIQAFLIDKLNWFKEQEKMKIKIIDLLIMIANDNAPKKFRYKRKIWKITDFDEVEYENNYTYFFKENLDCLITKHLNDEVEIIEDEVEIVEEDIKENPTFEEYKENPEKYWNKLCKDLDEIKQYLKND